jgi:predicted RecA/RadA family phage recombinase
MVSTIGIGNDTAPVVTAAFRSDGQTIPWIETGTASARKSIGDVVERLTALQSIGVVSAVRHDYAQVGTVGDELQLRVEGMFFAPKTSEALADGARVAWDTSNLYMAANATGAHEVVGGYESGDSHVLVRINKFPAAAT